MTQKIILLLCCSAIFVSCQRSIETFDSPGGADTASSGLLVKYVEVWNGGDSFITNYKYDNNRLLTEENILGNKGYKHYYRDNSGRVEAIEGLYGHDTIRTDVYYINENSANIVYTATRAKNGAAKILDSIVYVYTSGQLVKTSIYYFDADTASLSSYATWAYDTKGNISQLKSYTKNDDGIFSFNIGYDFEYDNNPNPFFSPDDARQVWGWYISSSPNNCVKQTNHYGDPPLHEDDYVALVYQYGPGGKPSASVRTGTAIGTASVQSSYYYK